jgi:hypothetical protein
MTCRPAARHALALSFALLVTACGGGAGPAGGGAGGAGGGAAAGAGDPGATGATGSTGTTGTVGSTGTVGTGGATGSTGTVGATGGTGTTAAPPSILALNRHGSPPAGGDIVLLIGQNLATADQVTFGGVPATTLAYDGVNGYLQVTSPPHAEGFVDVVVRLADLQTATFPGFHYGPPPVIASFTPGTGRPGDTVTISGTGFADVHGVSVRFGAFLAPIVSKSATSLVVTVPKVNPLPYTVTVVNFDDQFDASATMFTVQ